MKTLVIFMVLIASCLYTKQINASNLADSIQIKVHFLHGSKPKRAYRHTEDRWFGGVLGGHAGIEYKPNQIVNFQPKSRFHLFYKKQIINSKFSIHDTLSFYEILGGNSADNKKTIVSLKLSAEQYRKLDSTVTAYRKKSPYDYAFFGMRCGAATYDLLAQCGVLPKLSTANTWRKNFYPKVVRRKVEDLAKKSQTEIRKNAGSTKRIWEKD